MSSSFLCSSLTSFRNFLFAVLRWRTQQTMSSAEWISFTSAGDWPGLDIAHKVITLIHLELKIHMWIRSSELVSTILLRNASHRAIRMEGLDWFTYSHRFVGFLNFLANQPIKFLLFWNKVKQWRKPTYWCLKSIKTFKSTGTVPRVLTCKL